MILRLLQLNCTFYSYRLEGVSLLGVYGLFDLWVESTQNGILT